MKKIMIMACLLGCNLLVYGQINFTEGTINANLNRSGIVDEIDNRTSDRNKEDLFIGDHWFPGQVGFINGDIYKQGELRYNLNTKRLEILMSSEVIKVADLYLLKFFEYYASNKDTIRFINVSNYAGKLKTDELGIHEVLVNDEVSLLKHHFLKTLKSNYVPAFDLGSTEDQLVIEHEYFLLNKRRIYKISKRKDLLELFENGGELKGFIKKNSMKMRDEADLVQIIEKVNSEGWSTKD